MFRRNIAYFLIIAFSVFHTKIPLIDYEKRNFYFYFIFILFWFVLV
jgi:hypothetical protein